MTYLLKLLTVAVIVLGLVACGGAAQPTASVPTAGNTQPPAPTGAPRPTVVATHAPPAEPTGAPQPTGVGDTAIAIYHKSGGIMGLDETLTVRADGTLMLQSRGGTTKTAQVQPDQLDKLRKLLASSEFAKLQTQYQAAGADQFTYDISVPGGTPAHVITMDGVENPSVLDDVIHELNHLRQAV